MPKQKRQRKALPIKKKLDLILQKEEQVLRQEKKIEKEEQRENKEYMRLEEIEEKTSIELADLEKLEREVKEQIKDHPLKKIGARDLVRGFVGAFVGVIIHNALYYGTEIAEQFDTPRAIIWFILAFFVGAAMLYATGYRKIKDKNVLWFMPIRLTLLYTVALVVSATALFIYLPGYGNNMAEALKQLAAVQMSAIIGATTADIIGHE